MRSSIITLAFWLIITLPQPVVADDLQLTAHSAEYKISISGVSGQLETRLERDNDGQYVATHGVRPTGFARLIAGGGTIREQSTFSIDGSELRGKRYVSADELTREKGTVSIDFDHEARRMVGTIDLEDTPAETVDRPLDGVLFDRVSVQYQLMLDLKNKPETDSDPDAQPRTYTIFDIDGTKRLEVSYIGEKIIKVGGERFATIGVRHQSPGSSRRTELWLAPDLDYLPVLIEQYRKEKRKLRATLREYEPAD